MNPQSPRVAMVSGEASGDVLAGLLLEGLRARWPHLIAEGIGGPKMAEQGFDAWWPHDKLAVRGYVEVLGHFREIVGSLPDLVDALAAPGPDRRTDEMDRLDADRAQLHLEIEIEVG